MTPYNEIELRTGLSFVSASEEPLVELLEDICIMQCYTPGDFEGVAVQAGCGGETGRAMVCSRGFEEANSLYSRDITGSVSRSLTPG